MDPVQTNNMTEARALIVMVQFYRGMWYRRSHILAPLTDSTSVPKGRKILCNYLLEYSFKNLKHIVYDEMF